MIVKTMQLGNTEIAVCDDAYKDKKPEDIEKILERISLNIKEAVVRQENLQK